MADLVDRNELRDALYEADAVTMQGVKIINQFPSVNAAPVGWISVKDKLPEPEHEFDARNWYLVALSNGVVKELAYEFHNHSIFGYGWRETAYPVTHWMPLPEPPMSARMDGDAERRNA